MTREAGSTGGPGTARLPRKPSFGEEDPAFYEALGRAIKVARTQQDLGRKTLAERASVSYAYLSDIETGRGRPSSKALLAIAAALGRTPSELLQEAELYGAMQGLAEAPGEHPVPRTAAPSPAPDEPRPWFHADAARSVTRSSLAPEAPARIARSELQRLARSRLAGVTTQEREELRAIVDGLSDEDVRAVLQIARRLLVR